MSSSSHILYPRDWTDKISKLPDDILLDVLLILDLTHAAQTSVLAKRWRYLWTSRTDLNLDPENAPFKNKLGLLTGKIGPHVYLNWVNQVVDAHRAPCINKFRFYFRCPMGNDHSHVEKWARFAFSKSVTDLDLDLLATLYTTRFSLGFDILGHPPYYNGIVNLKSLRLSYVDISGEALEFILLHCLLLERLYVCCSETLHTLNIVSDKLKHLTLITTIHLKELRIDAVNLISFHFEDTYPEIDVNYGTRMVCNRVPKLVDMCFEGEICRYPFPFLGQLSYLFNQLTRLSFHPAVILDRSIFRKYSDFRPGFDMLFPNVKQLILTVSYLNWAAKICIKFFIKACPMLRELKLQVIGRQIGRQFQQFELENEIVDDISMEGIPNLKALEIVSFDGCDDDIKWILDVIAGANCLETLICDPLYLHVIGTHWEQAADVARSEETGRQARKLSKLVPGGVRVGLRDKNGLCWVSQIGMH